jgi:phenylpyruvate tautomerase PptA (4-oxalocrotonate tautomerase family)
VCCIIVLSGCNASKKLDPQPPVQPPQELQHISQDVYQYIDNFKDTNVTIDQESYEKQYFKVWNLAENELSKKDAMWGFQTFKFGKSYGENLQPLPKDFFSQALENANFQNYNTLHQNAVSLYELNIRVFPTEKPLLHDPQLAGEGFPFDYLQNSTIHANKPLLVTHYSKDKEWVHVVSSFAFGWVRTREIAFLEKNHTNLWQKAQQAVVIKEGVAIYSKSGEYLFRSRLGMMFALISEDETSYTILTLSHYKLHEPLFMEAVVSKDILHKGIVPLRKNNIAAMIQEIQHSHYGWGGIYNERDCSSTLRDFFAPFGIWLPRNSYKQSLVGEVISLEGMSAEQKIATIKTKGIPFKTLLYKRGHILLYVGVKNDKIIVFQNLWGIKTIKNNKEGREIVGKTIFSTLELGSNLKYYDKNSSILTKLKSFNIITP